jgi:hypothetical protein
VQDGGRLGHLVAQIEDADGHQDRGSRGQRQDITWLAQVGEHVGDQWRGRPQAKKTAAVIGGQPSRAETPTQHVQHQHQADPEHLAQVVDQEVQVVAGLGVAA